jgi:hypothetical protein
MVNYDLLSLSWLEFECLTRDLLQYEFNLYIESFTSGKDDGIDLRFAFSKDMKSIIQCKRIENFSSLLSQLRKELKKISGKYFERYYISTTVGLTPNRKKKIYQLFYPFIKDEADIFGKNDILNLISKYPKIEDQYPKLWMTSSTVLKKLLNAKVYNSSRIESQQIKDTVRIYVHNESYGKAQKILNENHYIIISGIPGIGKTTLAKMLVYSLIANGLNEFVYISSNISDAYKSYYENSKQVFLFDDFLGSNFLEEKLSRNEDQQLISFMRKIKKTNNKYFIMTTREYILKQAQQKYEALDNNNIDIAKCIIDLSLYTPLIRAKILYNHLFFSDMPKICLQDILKSQKYFSIINHKNYNPRIIESILDKKEWLYFPTNSYYDTFISYFNNPESVWKHAFEQQISPLSRITLIILGSINGPIDIANLQNAIKNYLKHDYISYVVDFNIDFDKSLKELAGSFISIEKDDKNVYAVKFYNPSVLDFIHSYLFNHTDIIKSIINSCIYFDQIITIYKIYISKGDIPDEIKTMCEDKIFECFDELTTVKSEKSSFYEANKYFWKPEHDYFINMLYSLSSYIFPLNNKKLSEYLKNKFYKEFDNISWHSSYRELVDIYLAFYEYETIECFEIFLECLVSGSDELQSIIEISRLKDIDRITFDKIMDNENTKKIIYDITEIECDSDGHNIYEYIKENVIEVSKIYNINFDNFIEKLNEKIENDKDNETPIKLHVEYKEDEKGLDQDEEIKELFNTLLYK